MLTHRKLRQATKEKWQKVLKGSKLHLFNQTQYGEDKMFCLVRFLVLLIQTSDTSGLFCTFNIPKFKKGNTKRSHYKKRGTTCVVDAW